MFKKSLKNMFSNMKPYQSYESMAENMLMMPLANDDCNCCGKCVSSCASKAIMIKDEWTVDIGKCIFCKECVESCDSITLVPTPFCVSKREDLIFKKSQHGEFSPVRLSDEDIKTMGNSVAVRELDVGSCGACESEISAMSNKYYDMDRFGIHVVPSPRHADVLLVTGPMTFQMMEAAEKTYAAVPDKKFVVACGTCAISGGLFVEGDVVGHGVKDTLPVDLYIPGCPPSPNRILVSLIGAFGLNH